MPFLTISQGTREGAYTGDDGVLYVTLIEVGDPEHKDLKPGDKAQTCQAHGQSGYDMIEWTFAVDSGEHEGELLWKRTSTATGPKSKIYGHLTALFGGKAPPVGFVVEREHIIGRRALATVKRNEEGFVDIVNLSALPSAPKAAAAEAPAAPAAPPAAPTPPLREQVAAATQDLPF